MSRQAIIQDLQQNGSKETFIDTVPSLLLQRLCAQQSELLRNHDVALQEMLVAIKTAFQPTEDVADSKAEEIPKEETRPRCILSYAWPSDTYQEKEAYLQPFLDFLYDHLSVAGIEVHLDFREPEFDTTNQRETIYDTIHRHYRPGTFIVLMGTESLRAQHDTSTSGPMQFELDRVRACLSQADGSVYPLLLSGTHDSAYPDDIAGYIKIQNAENLSYLNLLQQLIDRLYSQDTQSFWEALETNTMLPENTEAISEALSHQLHQNRLTDLQQTPAYQTIQMQRQKKISECLSAKLFVAFQEAMGEPIQYIKDEHGFRFHCPPENDHFIERPALLTKLREYFLQPGRQLLTLTAQGLGGVGKTQLAQHVYLHPPQPYALRAWFQAGSREQLSLQYIELGKAQGVKFADELPLEEKVARVLRWLEQQPDCLLMYDDVSDKAMLEGLLPQKGSSHILITTRHGKDWPVSQCLDVDVMEPEEAKALIETIVGPQDPTELGTLVNALGRLPLALAQAAWYMRQENCGAGAYLTLYQKRQAHLMQHTEGLPRSKKQDETWEKHEAVWVTFDINFEALKQTCPQALLTLNQVSWLASTPVPEMLLQSIMDSKKTTMPERLFEWANIKKQLTAYSLMQVDVKGQTLRMHNLVQDILRDQQTSNEKVESFKQTCNALDNLYAQYHKEGNLAYRVLLEHAMSLYKHNVLIASLVFDDTPDLIKVKPLYLALIYRNLGMTKESLGILEKQRVVYEAYFGPNHPVLVATLVNLGNAYGVMGDVKRQYDLQTQALAIQKRHYDAEHPAVAQTLVNLGNAYGALGDVRRQCELLTEALAIQKRHYGAGHPDMAPTLGNLGIAYGALGDVRRQCELQMEVLAIQKRHYGAEHPEVAQTLVNLGSAYGVIGDAKRQCELQTEALTIQKRHYGAEHPEVAGTLVNLGIAYNSLGDAQRAYELQMEALAIQKRHYGAEHFEVARTLVNLGNTYGTMGDAKRQCELLTKALAIQKRHYGAEHPEVAMTLGNLGAAYCALGDTKRQCELQTEALTIKKRHYGAEHPEVARTLGNLGSAYGVMGDAKRQCELQTEALTIQKKLYGPSHPNVATVLHNLAIGYAQLKHLTQALEFSQRACQIYRRSCPQGHPNLINSEKLLKMLKNKFHLSQQSLESYNLQADIAYENAIKAFKSGNYLEAKTLLEDFLQEHVARAQEEDTQLSTAYFNLGSACRKLGQFQEALPHYRQCYRIRRTLLGEIHERTQHVRARIKTVRHEIQVHVELELVIKLGTVVHKQSQYAFAVQCYKKALEHFQELYEQPQKEMSTVYYNLGSCYLKLGKIPLAHKFYNMAVDLRTELLGIDHESTQKAIQKREACRKKMNPVVSKTNNQRDVSQAPSDSETSVIQTVQSQILWEAETNPVASSEEAMEAPSFL